MLSTFSALLWVLFGDFCPLYYQLLKICRVLNHPLLKSVKSNFTRVRCSHITWQVLEETRMFFNRWMVPNDFINKGPRRFPTIYLWWLIEYVRRNNFLDLVTMPRQWNNQESGNTWATHHGKGQGGVYKQIGVFMVPSKGQRFWTLTQRKHGMELDIKYQKGRDGRRQTKNTDTQCSSNLWIGYCNNMPHLIFQNCWLQETGQW